MAVIMKENTNENCVRTQCTPRAAKKIRIISYFHNIGHTFKSTLQNNCVTHPGNKLSRLVQGMPKEIVLVE